MRRQPSPRTGRLGRMARKREFTKNIETKMARRTHQKLATSTALQDLLTPMSNSIIPVKNVGYSRKLSWMAQCSSGQSLFSFSFVVCPFQLLSSFSSVDKKFVHFWFKKFLNLFFFLVNRSCCFSALVVLSSGTSVITFLFKKSFC